MEAAEAENLSKNDTLVMSREPRVVFNTNGGEPYKLQDALSNFLHPSPFTLLTSAFHPGGNL